MTRTKKAREQRIANAKAKIAELISHGVQFNIRGVSGSTLETAKASDTFKPVKGTIERELLHRASYGEYERPLPLDKRLPATKRNKRIKYIPFKNLKH